MSADNFIAIVKKGRNYIGYYCSASHNYPYVKCFPCLGREAFRVRKLREAVNEAQDINTEYGYSVYDWEEDINTNCPCETRKFIDGEIE